MTEHFCCNFSIPSRFLRCFNVRKGWSNPLRCRSRKSAFNSGPEKQVWSSLNLIRRFTVVFSNFANVYGICQLWCELILFLSVFLCPVAFFSCDSFVVKFELLENVCGVVFVLFAQCGHFLSCDLAITKVIVYLCITNFKKTKEHPCTETLFLLIHVVQEVASVQTSQSPSAF